MAHQLELAEMIRSLRAELAQAQMEGEEKAIRFLVEEVDLELDIVAEEKVKGGIAAKFYVLTSQLKATKKDVAAQKLKLKLRPHGEIVDSSTGEKKTVPVKIGGKVKAEG